MWGGLKAPCRSYLAKQTLQLVQQFFHHFGEEDGASCYEPSDFKPSDFA